MRNYIPLRSTLWFTLKEVMQTYIEDFNMFVNKQDVLDILDEIGIYNEEDETPFNPMGLRFVEYMDLSTMIFNRVLERYKKHFFLRTCKDEIDAEERDDVMRELFRVLDFTFPKYSALLALYEDNKEHLIQAVKSIDSETTTSSQSENHSSTDTGDTTEKMNDTPQASNSADPFSGDSYVSEITKGHSSTTGSGSSSVSGSATISRTHSDDRDTLMARIDEVSRKYQDTLLMWLNEFERVFVEEGNI